MTNPAPTSTNENPLPCPVASPDGLPCRKPIPKGWTADEGHAGGHFWMSDAAFAIVAGGHFDASAALAGVPFTGHLPEDCPGGTCPNSPDRRT
ncbi:hypothetical protein BDK92_7140 [Micromonospora pisi]|uniref:Uncharacterized protein n=1 Tax=Micromonospora pisi TaxID=589240 RepID=A0A495JWN2_9ACTN|nr:hypothetical protein [Micromonospora pisi]RKR92664.1 hypothetical protein BDK92_7140 [Micromonospora pisi]